MRRILPLVFACVLSSSPLEAQEFWAKKDYTQWSARECERMLQDSPWSRTVAVRGVSPLQRSEAVDVVGPGATVEIVYKAQLRSALPVRQAMVRQSRMNNQSRELSPVDQQTQEERYSQLLAAEFPDRIIFVVEYSTHREVIGAVHNYWRSRAKADWDRDAILITPAGRFTPLEVNMPQGNRTQFQLIFPRLASGKPVIQPADGEFALEFSQPTIRGVPGQRLRFEFRVKEMSLNGQLAF